MLKTAQAIRYVLAFTFFFSFLPFLRKTNEQTNQLVYLLLSLFLPYYG